MKNSVAAAFVGMLGLVAAAYPVQAKAIKLTDGQLDGITAGGTVIITDESSVGVGIVYDTSVARANSAVTVGYGVSIALGTSPQSSLTVGGSDLVYSDVIHGGSGPISFTVGVGVAR